MSGGSALNWLLCNERDRKRFKSSEANHSKENLFFFFFLLDMDRGNVRRRFPLRFKTTSERM